MRKAIAVFVVVTIGLPAAATGFIVYALCHGWNIGTSAYSGLWKTPR